MSCSSGNIGPYGKNVSKHFFSLTTWTIETKLPRNNHWKVLKKTFFFLKFLEDLPMIIPGQFGFNCPSGLREEVF
jgi:hypothetical protein